MTKPSLIVAICPPFSRFNFIRPETGFTFYCHNKPMRYRIPAPYSRMVADLGRVSGRAWNRGEGNLRSGSIFVSLGETFRRDGSDQRKRI